MTKLFLSKLIFILVFGFDFNIIVVFLSMYMSKDIFKFRKFSVSHAKSSMRVGTDAVLLGAWAEPALDLVSDSFRVLDIGCGCGLIGMMIAQRFPGLYVVGVDIDEASILEANENADNSPFADRLSFACKDIREFSKEESLHNSFRFILCNPPYYTEDTLPPDERRSKARNSAHLTFTELLKSVRCLLSEQGVFSVVLPMQAREMFVTEAIKVGLYIKRECRVQTTLSKTPKRVLLEFEKKTIDFADIETLILQGEDGKRSRQYSLLCQDFYL